MTKLIIQIPCYNEEATLPSVINSIPQSISGVDVIELQIIDDGSNDRTVEVAKSLGVRHIVKFSTNMGLAAAFRAGVENAIREGADILVNTDGDNQYSSQDIPKLIQPILLGRAEMVVGARPIIDHPEFSTFKKSLQIFGSWVLRKASNTDIPDAASGFRAYSRNCLMHLNVYSKFSYCMETLIQAGLSNIKVESIPIRVNPKTRDSRLFSSIPAYVYKSGTTIINIFLIYRSKAFFFTCGFLSFVFSLVLFVRYFILVTFYSSPSSSFWPSIILAGIFLGLSVQLVLTGIITSLIAANRHLAEEILYKLRKDSIK